MANAPSTAARALYEESLAIWRELGDRKGIAPTLGNLGNVAWEQGDLASAQALYEESLAIKRQLGDRGGIANSIENLEYVRIHSGRISAAIIQPFATETAMTNRQGGRRADQLRPLSITRHYARHAEGSALIECGETRVVCTASVEDGVPPFLKGKGRGWLTAEYGMLPRATNTRMRREAAEGKQSGRTQEIQRLIGRSLRAVADLSQWGERTIRIDCDVLQADGGTRCASITGACVALYDAVAWCKAQGLLTAATPALRNFVAAVSVGILDGIPMLDLDYSEDSACDTDMNVVMTGAGGFVEIQGTAEGATFSRSEMDTLVALAEGGIGELIGAQKKALGVT